MIKKSGIKYFVYISSALILAISLIVYFKPKALVVEKTQPKMEYFAETVVAEGKIRSQVKQTLMAFTSGNADGIKLKVGDHVKKNQLLTTIHSENSAPVRSPMDGIISKIYKESASPVVRGEPLAEIINPKTLAVVTELLTSDTIRLNEGNEAQITGWGDKSELKGHVIKISKAGYTKVSALGVEEERTEVTISLDEVPEALLEKLGDNFHVDVSIKATEVSDALTLPLGALFRDKEDWFVYVIASDKARLRKIQIDRKNDQKAVITSGVTENDLVILFPGDKIKDGTAVK